MEDQKDQKKENSELENLKQELEKIKQERDEYLNGWKRAKADLINYQKDEGKRFEEVIRYSNEAILRDLIVVLDSFEIGLTTLEKENKADKGIYIIKSQLEDVLKKNGLEKIKVSPGDAFDPSRHESLGEVAGLPAQAGKIAEEIESGYILNGKVVRPARVKLSK
jgi:molecular chaperone GrpE